MLETIQYAQGNYTKPRFIAPPKWQRIFSTALLAASLLFTAIGSSLIVFLRSHGELGHGAAVILFFLVYAQVDVVMISLIWLVVIGVLPLGTRSNGVSKLNLLLTIGSLGPPFLLWYFFAVVFGR